MCGRRACLDDGSPMRLLRSPWLWIVLAALVVAASLPWYVSGYVLGLLTVAYYFGVFSMSWDLLFGFAGEVNFGPTFLIGVGAYTAGILDNRYGWSPYLCIALGALAAVVAGFLLALPALRVRGPYFGLITLVAVLILQSFVVVFADLTGGEIGLTIPDVLAIDAGVNYWIALGLMTFSGAILFGLARSPVGLIAGRPAAVECGHSWPSHPAPPLRWRTGRARESLRLPQPRHGAGALRSYRRKGIVAWVQSSIASFLTYS